MTTISDGQVCININIILCISVILFDKLDTLLQELTVV